MVYLQFGEKGKGLELPVGASNIEHFSNRTLVPTSGGISGICGADRIPIDFPGWVPTVAQPDPIWPQRGVNSMATLFAVRQARRKRHWRLLSF